VVGDLFGDQGKGLNSVVEHNSNGPWVDALLLRLEASKKARQVGFFQPENPAVGS